MQNNNIIPTNSQTITPSEMNDLVNYLDINTHHQLTSNDINKLAYQYVQQQGELIKSNMLAVSLQLQKRLAILFGYPSTIATLPLPLCNFLQRINCVNPSQVINKLGGDRTQLAYSLAQSNPSTLFQQHFQELWILFAFSRDYIFSFPLDQRSFRARTWHNLRCKEAYDEEFYRIEPEEFKEIRESLLESSKEKAKTYIENIYKMIIRWCNNNSTLTDSKSSHSSSFNNDKTESGASSISNSSLSSCETDLNLSKTKRMDKTQKRRHKKRKDKEKKDIKISLPEVVEKDTSKSSNNINNANVSNNLITLDNSTANCSTNIDDGIPLDKFQHELFQSSHQYLPTWNNERKSSGFNAPISPLDSNKFYPGCNDGIQGATNAKPQDHDVYMSGVSQHSVQNKYRAPVTPLLSHTTPLNRNSNATPKVTFNTSISTQKDQVTNMIK